MLKKRDKFGVYLGVSAIELVGGWIYIDRVFVFVWLFWDKLIYWRLRFVPFSFKIFVMFTSLVTVIVRDKLGSCRKQQSNSFFFFCD